MRANEFILEKINMSLEYQQKIEDIVYKWGEWVGSTIAEYQESSEFQSPEQLVQHDTKFHRLISNQLVKYLQPTIKTIINKNITSKFTPDPDYAGHKVRFELAVESGSALKGGTYGKWAKQYTTKPTYILSNKILVSVTPGELLAIIKHGERATMELASTIAHELTHIAQSLRSPLQSVQSSSYTNRHISDEDVAYFTKKFESEAFAEGTVLKIIAKAKKSGDPAQYIRSTVLQPLRMGISSLFNRELFPNQDYEKIKTILKSKSDSPEIEHAKQQAWKRFNKKIYEKLMAYLSMINS